MKGLTGAIGRKEPKRVGRYLLGTVFFFRSDLVTIDPACPGCYSVGTLSIFLTQCRDQFWFSLLRPSQSPSLHLSCSLPRDLPPPLPLPSSLPHSCSIFLLPSFSLPRCPFHPLLLLPLLCRAYLPHVETYGVA